MSRIRTVKPEFWTDETIGCLPVHARLLFIATWNLADDEGILQWTPAYLKASVFMYDEKVTIGEVDRLMSRLVDEDLVFPYVAGKTRQKLALIINFRRHQRINRPQPSKLPPPSLQNKDVVAMYCRRDRWVCHVCGEAVNAEPWKDTSGDDSDLWSDDSGRPAALNPVPNHLVSRLEGGLDYPSNIRITHVSCHKAGGTHPPPDSSTDSVNGSLNGAPPEGVSEAVTDSLSHSAPEGKGREGKGSKTKDPYNETHEGGYPQPVENRDRDQEVHDQPPDTTGSRLLAELEAVCTATNRTVVRLEAIAVVAWAREHVDAKLVEQAIGAARLLPEAPALPRAVASLIQRQAADWGNTVPTFQPALRVGA